jgi:hypothetical protein
MYTNPSNVVLIILGLFILLTFEVISLWWSPSTCPVLPKDEKNVYNFRIPLRNHSDNTSLNNISSILDHTISSSSPELNLSYYNHRLLQIATIVKLVHSPATIKCPQSISCNDSWVSRLIRLATHQTIFQFMNLRFPFSIHIQEGHIYSKLHLQQRHNYIIIPDIQGRGVAP